MLGPELLHAQVRFCSKALIADGKHFIEQEDVRVDVGRNPETEARQHPRR